jgi:hypothetical protein
MISNAQNITLNDNLREIDNNLSIIEETLKDIVKISIQEMNNSLLKEKELISLWTKHTSNINNFFFEECDKSGNKRLYKNIIKYMMFNR